MNEFTKDKQEVSSLTWLFGFAVSWFISCLVVKSIYELNDSSLNGSGLIAIGSVLAVIYFSMTTKAALGEWGRLFLGVGIFAYCLVVVPVEVFSLFTNNVANSGGEELSQVREIKDSAQEERKELRQEKKEIENSTMSDNAKRHHKKLINDQLTELKSEANLIIDSNQGKAFDDIGKRFGIDNIESIYKSVMAALLICVMPLLNISRNGTYCGLTLLIHKAKTGVMGWMMEEKPEVIKTVKPEDLKEQGTHKDEPKVKGDIEAAKQWIASHLSGSELSTKELRKATGTSIQIQQNAIIKELYNTGYLTRVKKGNIYKYSRADAKTQALSTMQKTRNFLSLVKSK